MTIVSGASLFVDFRKWPDTSHWHFRLGEDAHGTCFPVDPVCSVAQSHPPEDVIRNADRAAKLLAQRIERREEPFARVGEAWLARGTSGS